MSGYLSSGQNENMKDDLLYIIYFDVSICIWQAGAKSAGVILAWKITQKNLLNYVM